MLDGLRLSTNNHTNLLNAALFHFVTHFLWLRFLQVNKPYYGTSPTLSPDLGSNQLKHLISRFIYQPSDPYIFYQVVSYLPPAPPE